MRTTPDPHRQGSAVSFFKLCIFFSLFFFFCTPVVFAGKANRNQGLRRVEFRRTGSKRKDKKNNPSPSPSPVTVPPVLPPNQPLVIIDQGLPPELETLETIQYSGINPIPLQLGNQLLTIQNSQRLTDDAAVAVAAAAAATAAAANQNYLSNLIPQKITYTETLDRDSSSFARQRRAPAELKTTILPLIEADISATTLAGIEGLSEGGRKRTRNSFSYANSLNDDQTLEGESGARALQLQLAALGYYPEMSRRQARLYRTQLRDVAEATNQQRSGRSNYRINEYILEQLLRGAGAEGSAGITDAVAAAGAGAAALQAGTQLAELNIGSGAGVQAAAEVAAAAAAERIGASSGRGPYNVSRGTETSGPRFSSLNSGVGRPPINGVTNNSMYIKLPTSSEPRQPYRIGGDRMS